MTNSSADDWMQRSRLPIQAAAFGAFILIIPALSFVNRSVPALTPTVITECEHYKLGTGSRKFTSREMYIGLANGHLIHLDGYEYGVGIDQCLPVGTTIERRVGDIRYRLNGSRPKYDWQFLTFMEVLGSVLLSWGAAGMWRLRKDEALRPDFAVNAETDRWTVLVFQSARLAVVHALVLAGCLLAVWFVSDLVGGLQKYELMLASAGVAAVSACIGLRLLESPWRRWTATKIRLDRAGIVVHQRLRRRPRLQMPFVAIAEFASSRSNPRALTIATSESTEIALGIEVSDNAGANLLAERLNHAVDALRQPHNYRE